MNRLAIAVLLGFLWFGSAASGDSAPTTVKLARTYTIKELPEFGRPFNYYDINCTFPNKDTFACVRPLEGSHCGELSVCWPRTGKVERMKIPQPAGFKPEVDVFSYFDHAGVWANGQGDFFFRWDIKGNGDHGLAMLPRGSKDFVVTRSDLYLMTHSRPLVAPDGTWYFLRWSANRPQGYAREVYKVAAGDKLSLELLGTHKGPGHHAYGTLDACFLSQTVIHFIWAEVEKQNNHLRLLTANFDVQKKTWSPARVLLRQAQFTSWAKPAVVALADGSVHYLWTISEGEKRTEASGLFYQASGQKAAVRLSASIDGFKAVPVGNRIAVCYTLPEAPDKVFFRVIHDGKVGPEAAIKITNGLKHSLYGDYLVLAVAGEDRLWLVNTLDINTFYELACTEVDKPQEGQPSKNGRNSAATGRQ